MTIILKMPSRYYRELVNTFPPSTITNEAELVATQDRIHTIVKQKKLTQDDRYYVKALELLIDEYARVHC